MRPIRRNYDIAGAFVMVSGLLYTFMFLLEGWDGRTKTFLAIGLFFIVTGLVLRQRRRWLAYILYALMLIALLVSLVAMGTSPIAIGWWILVMIFQALAVFHLFRILWAPKGEFDK